LPAAFEAPAELHQESKPRCVRGGSETILIAEDDLQVRRLTTVILKEQGYRVLAAENAEAAISLANNHPGPIHLILTDIIMSDMNGKQLFEKVSTISPDIRVLYMSGYAGDVIA
jgi:DNA-binding NtrC family response regulator